MADTTSPAMGGDGQYGPPGPAELGLIPWAGDGPDPLDAELEDLLGSP